jgi:hypothetical protein
MKIAAEHPKIHSVNQYKSTFTQMLNIEKEMIYKSESHNSYAYILGRLKQVGYAGNLCSSVQ